MPTRRTGLWHGVPRRRCLAVDDAGSTGEGLHAAMALLASILTVTAALAFALGKQWLGTFVGTLLLNVVAVAVCVPRGAHTSSTCLRSPMNSGHQSCRSEHCASR